MQTCDGGLWYYEMLNCGHEIWVWISVCLTLDVTILMLWAMNYTIIRLVFILRKTCMHGVEGKV